MNSDKSILAPLVVALGLSAPMLAQADEGKDRDHHESRSGSTPQGGAGEPTRIRLDRRMGTTAGGGSGGERSGVIVAPAALPIRQGFSSEIELMEQKVRAAEATLQAIKDAHRAGRFYTTAGPMPVISVATTVTQTAVEMPVIETNTPQSESETVNYGDGGDGGAGDGEAP